MNNPQENISKENIFKASEIIISLAALVLFGVLFFVTQLFQNPFIVFGVILFVLFPFRKSSLVKVIISLSAIVFCLWFFNSILSLLAPFIIAFIISYALNPVVEYLTAKKFSRAVASALILVVFLIIIVTAILLLAPPIVGQFSDLIKTLPQALNNLQDSIKNGLIPKLNAIGVPTQDIQDKISQDLPQKLDNVLKGLLTGLSGVFAGLSVVLTELVNLILIPFLTFYIMKDFDDIKSFVKELFPPSKRKKARSNYHKIDDMLGSFIRGQLLVSIIHGIVAFIFLSILGVKYAIFLGALGVVLNLIPYFGLLVEMTLALIVSLFSGNAGLQVPLVLIIYLLQNLLETSVIIPKIVGEKIGLHPALLILSLLVFSYFFGFLGMIIALPTMSIIIMFFKEWLNSREAKETKAT